MLLIVLIVMLFVELSRYEKVKHEVKVQQLSKIKAEIYAQRKKEQFEEYRNYIENKYNVVDIKECIDEVGASDDQEVTLLEGVVKLRNNGHKYIPYVRSNPLDDIRNSLREFTVGDVLKTFY